MLRTEYLYKGQSNIYNERIVLHDISTRNNLKYDHRRLKMD